ncbi:hypothetical protein BN871_AT_00050 [Paenibacillus sp. P22]|nr:hypothetical protein BN871_AT_00050 [Paenibacillus sp. P22]
MRGQDLNLRPSGYEPDELPDCSTPRRPKKERFRLEHKDKYTIKASRKSTSYGKYLTPYFPFLDWNTSISRGHSYP